MMLARLRALVGGRKPTENVDMLPPELQVVISGAQIIERHGADENSTRTLVQCARGSFWFDETEPRKWVAANWPELTAAQQSRALGMLGSRVAQAQREHAAAAAAVRGGSSWRDWKPAEKVWPGA
ncbi:hypothetical protein [Ralstonia pseudosolanacearum]|uniref:hypothetical protein n=1 Tax=Ralstonia pseudosolanacearum TaxID=1310165 RepID=UPI0039C6CF35